MPSPELGLLSLGGSVLGAFGAYDSATAEQGAMNYEASIAQNNQILANYQAEVARRVGVEREQNVDLHSAQVYGAQRASMAANGVELGSGSATAVLGTTKFMGLRDALTVRHNTDLQAWGLEQEGKNFGAEADLYKGLAGSIHPREAALGSLLGSAPSVADTWMNL